jgi:hypothetical protein
MSSQSESEGPEKKITVMSSFITNTLIVMGGSSIAALITIISLRMLLVYLQSSPRLLVSSALLPA